MRFTTLAMVAGAMLVTIRAAPLSVRHDSSVSSGASDTSTSGNGVYSGHQGVTVSSGRASGDGSSYSSGGDRHGSPVSVDNSGEASAGAGAGQDDAGKSNKEATTWNPYHSADGQSQQAGTSSTSEGANESKNGHGYQIGHNSGDESGQGKADHQSDAFGKFGNGLNLGSGKSGKSDQGVDAIGKSGSELGLGIGSSGNSLLSSLLPGLSDVSSVLDLNSILSMVERLPSKVQSQILEVVNQPAQLTKVIGSLPSQLKTTQIAGLSSKVHDLPTGLPAKLADLSSQVTLLPANLQAIVGQLPAVLQAKVIALPSLIHNLPSQINVLPSSLQSKLNGVPDLLTTALANCQFDEALKVLESLLGNNGGSESSLPAQLQQQLTIVQSTLIQLTTSTTSSSGHGDNTGKSGHGDNTGNSGTVTTLTGAVVSVKSTTIMVVAELKTATGAKVSSLQDVVSIPVKFCQGTTGGSKKKGNNQISVSALMAVTGVNVAALTDKVALPLELANVLKSF